jgi:predicted secreted protein
MAAEMPLIAVVGTEVVVDSLAVLAIVVDHNPAVAMAERAADPMMSVAVQVATVRMEADTET